MQKISVEDAKAQLETLINTVKSGDSIAITLDDEIVAKIVPFRSEGKTSVRRPRQLGLSEGKIWMADDFDEPLSDFDEYMP